MNGFKLKEGFTIIFPLGMVCVLQVQLNGILLLIVIIDQQLLNKQAPKTQLRNSFYFSTLYRNTPVGHTCNMDTVSFHPKWPSLKLLSIILILLFNCLTFLSTIPPFKTEQGDDDPLLLIRIETILLIYR